MFSHCCIFNYYTHLHMKDGMRTILLPMAL